MSTMSKAVRILPKMGTGSSLFRRAMSSSHTAQRSQVSSYSLRTMARWQNQTTSLQPTARYATVQHYSTTGRSPADEIADELQQMYADTKDEFEIATESTEAHATYAAEDREAARDELEKLTTRWKEVLEMGGEVTEDLKKRPIGQRVRELTAAIEELNKKDYED